MWPKTPEEAGGEPAVICCCAPPCQRGMHFIDSAPSKSSPISPIRFIPKSFDIPISEPTGNVQNVGGYDVVLPTNLVRLTKNYQGSGRLSSG